MPKQMKFRMEKETDSIPTKLYIYDDVTAQGDFDWETFEYKESETSAKHIRDLLDQVPSQSTIELHVNSAGGEVGEGVTIYNLLRQKAREGCNVIGYVDGMAYSVAMDIMMACSEIHMGLGTSMFLHYPWMMAQGNAEALRGFADQLDALGDASVALYMDRAKNLQEADLRTMMSKETMLDPETCKKYGFCDVIDSYKSMKPEESKEQIDSEQLKQDLMKARMTRDEVMKMLQSLKKPEPKETNDLRKMFIAAVDRAAGRKK